MRQRRYTPNDAVSGREMEDYVRLITGMKAQWSFIHMVQRDVWDAYPHTVKNSKSRPPLGFEGVWGSSYRSANVILVNPFNITYGEMFNLIYEYYN